MRGFYCITICSLFLLLSCNYKKIKDPEAYNAQQNTGFGAPITSDLKLGMVTINEYVLKVCLRCHSGNQDPLLNTPDLVRQKIEIVAEEINSNGMPRAEDGFGPLSDCQKAMLNQWITEGTPDNSETTVATIEACKNDGDPSKKKAEIPLDQMPLTYGTLLEKILQPKCLSCHNSDNTTEAAETLFFPYDKLAVEGAAYWSTPGASSKINKRLTRQDSRRMPPPDKGEALSDAEVQFINKWIDAGKPQ